MNTQRVRQACTVGHDSDSVVGLWMFSNLIIIICVEVDSSVGRRDLDVRSGGNVIMLMRSYHIILFTRTNTTLDY